MELKNGCHPYFGEYPLTPSNDKSMVFTFSGTTTGKILISQPETTFLGFNHDNITVMTLLHFLPLRWGPHGSAFWRSCQSQGNVLFR
jgi:hypothetical protein